LFLETAFDKKLPFLIYSQIYSKMTERTKRQRSSLRQVEGLIQDLPLATPEMLTRAGVRTFKLPIVTTDLWKTFVANLAEAGYQNDKRRATWQWHTLKSLEAEDEGLANWLIEVAGVVETMGASAIANAIANVNEGREACRETHVDRFSAGATHRLLGYVVKDNCDSLLVVILDNKFHSVIIPSGTGIIAPQSLLAQEHMHGTQDTNFCFLAELSFEHGLEIPSSPEPLAALPPQPLLPFDIFASALGAEDPREHFLGSPSRFGSGFVLPTRAESMRFLAVSSLLRAKGHRNYGSKKAAWEQVRAMTESEVEALATKRGKELAAASFIMSQPDPPGNFDVALEQVRAMTESEVEALATKRGKELAAASFIMSQSDPPGNFDVALEQVRAMTESEVEALATKRGKELAAASFIMSQPDPPGKFDVALEQVRAMNPAVVSHMVKERMSELGKKLNCRLLVGYIMHDVCACCDTYCDDEYANPCLLYIVSQMHTLSLSHTHRQGKPERRRPQTRR
jgi:hypothetical protein